MTFRAPTVDVGYVPNAKYLAHIPYQTQKSAPIRCGICAKIIPHLSIPLQICNSTDRCDIILAHMPHLMVADFCVGCGIYAKYLAFGTYPTSTVGALIVSLTSSLRLF